MTMMTMMLMMIMMTFQLFQHYLDFLFPSLFLSLSLSLSHSILNDYYYYFSFDLIAELKFFEILSSRFVITLMIPSLSHLNQIHFDSAVFFFEWFYSKIDFALDLKFLWIFLNFFSFFGGDFPRPPPRPPPPSQLLWIVFFLFVCCSQPRVKERNPQTIT